MQNHSSPAVKCLLETLILLSTANFIFHFSSVQFNSVQHRDLSWDSYFVSPFTSLGQQARKLWVGNGPEVSHLSSGLSHRRKAVNKFVGPGDSFGQESLGFGQESWIQILKELS